jgi:peptidoglycan/LPS O-acetylase OafA/YrhL
MLQVMLYHLFMYYPRNELERWGTRLLATGWVAVDSFFVLSGFLITGILLDAKGREGYFSRFYIRRTLRVFPLYYIALVILILILPRSPWPAPEMTGPLVSHQAWYWGYVSNWLIALQGYGAVAPGTRHFWSLAVEEQFYLLWPMVVLLVPTRRLPWVCLTGAVGSQLLRIWLLAHGASPEAVYVLSPTRFDPLMVGSLVAVLARSPGGLEAHAREFRVAAWGGLLIMTALFFWRPGIDDRDPIVQSLGYAVVAVGFGGLVPLVAMAKPGSFLNRCFSHPFPQFWGHYSYSLYIFHPVFAVYLRHAGLDPAKPPAPGHSAIPTAIAFFTIGTALSVITALLSWNLIEKRFLALKRYFPVAG